MAEWRDLEVDRPFMNLFNEIRKTAFNFPPGDWRIAEKWSGENLSLRVLYDDDAGNFQLKVLHGGNFVLGFYVEHCLSCCALMQFRSFRHDSALTQEFVDKLLDGFFKYVHLGTYFANRRLLVAMVEPDAKETAKNRDAFNAKPNESLAEKWARVIARFKEPIELKENPYINYPLFYNYFKKQPVCRESLFPNVNSLATIHLMEVIIDKK